MLNLLKLLPYGKPPCFIINDHTLNRATSWDNAYLPLHDCEDTRSSNF